MAAYSAFSEIADTIGWSAETSTKRRCETSWMPFSERFSAVYPGNFFALRRVRVGVSARLGQQPGSRRASLQFVRKADVVGLQAARRRRLRVGEDDCERRRAVSLGEGRRRAVAWARRTRREGLAGRRVRLVVDGGDLGAERHREGALHVGDAHVVEDHALFRRGEECKNNA